MEKRVLVLILLFFMGRCYVTHRACLNVYLLNADCLLIAYVSC
jgi:hypothetical protein